MSGLEMAPAVDRRYSAILRALARVDRGRDLRDLGMAFDLAQALEAEPHDPERVDALAEQLGLDLRALP